MKRVSVTEAKTHLRALIDGLKSGLPVLIVDQGRPVARLEPVTAGGEAEHGGRLLRLVRDGLVRPGRSPPRALLSQTPPRAKPRASAVKALLEERREGR